MKRLLIGLAFVGLAVVADPGETWAQHHGHGYDGYGQGYYGHGYDYRHYLGHHYRGHGHDFDDPHYIPHIVYVPVPVCVGDAPFCPYYRQQNKVPVRPGAPVFPNRRTFPVPGKIPGPAGQPGPIIPPSGAVPPSTVNPPVQPKQPISPPPRRVFPAPVKPLPFGGQKTCPVTGEKLGDHGTPIAVTVQGHTIYVCCRSCVNDVRNNPGPYLRKVEAELNGR